MTTLTGVLNDSGGNPITGSLWLELSQPGAYNPGAILVTPLQPSVFTLTAGQITGPGAGPYTVYGNDGITPTSTWYVLTAFDTSWQQVLRVNVRIEGASVDLGALTIAPTQNWTPPVDPSLTLAGDVTGALGATVVSRIRGRSVAAPPWTAGHVLTVQGDGSLAFGPGILADGDKGDVTIAGGGATITIDPGVVTLAKLAGDVTAVALGGAPAVHSHAGLLSALTSGYVPRASGADSVVDSTLYTDGTNFGINQAAPTDAIHITRSGSRAGLFLDGQGAGGYGGLKLESAAATSAFLVSAGNVDGDGGLPTGAGFSVRDTNANADRLVIYNSGIVDVPGTLTMGGTSVSLVGHSHTGLLSGLTSGRVPYATGAAALTDDADLTFNGSTLSAQGLTVNQGALTLTPVAAPGAPTLSATVAGSKPAGIWNGKISWVTATGETALGTVSANITVDGTKAITVTQPANPPALATGWKYHSSKQGPTATWWVTSGTIPIATTTYDDNSADAALTVDATNRPATAGRRVYVSATPNLTLAPSVTTVGDGAGSAITTALYTVLVGPQAGVATTTAIGSVGVGPFAITSATTGNYLTGLGAFAGRLATTSALSTFVGGNAGYTSGATFSAANAVTTGSSLTFVGYASGLGSSTQRSNATALGYGAYVDADNRVALGNGSVVDVWAGSTGAAKLVGGSLGIGLTSSLTAPAEIKDTGSHCLRLLGSTSGYVGFRPAASAGSTTYTWPTADGTSGYVLATNGSGTLSWVLNGTGTVSGITSLGGQTGSTQTFSGSGGITVTSSANNHDIAWSAGGSPLGVANGGTGASTLTGLLRGNGTSAITGGATVSLSSEVTGTLGLLNGGTGESTAQAAMNALAGAVTSGYYLRGNGTNVVLSTIQAGDVPTLNQNTTGTAAGLSATLAVGSGGTGLTTLAAGRIPYGAGTSPFASTDKLVWDPTIEHLTITAKKGLLATGDCALQITSEVVGSDGERAAVYLQGLGTGGYAAFKMGCGATLSEYLVSVGNVGGSGGAGFAIRDTNAGADRLTISDTTGIVDAAAGLTVGGTAVSLAGHSHTGLLSGLTTNNIPKASSATALTASRLADDGTTIRLLGNTFVGGAAPGATPRSRLEVTQKLTSIAAGYGAAFRVNSGADPDYGTPGANANIAGQFFSNNASLLDADLWGLNVVVGHGGAPLAAPTPPADGIHMVGAEIEVFNRATSGNAQLNPIGAYPNKIRSNGIEVVGHSGSDYRNAGGVVVWANDATGTKWWDAGLSLSRSYSYGIRFQRVSGDSVQPFQTAMLDASELTASPQTFLLCPSSVATDFRVKNAANYDLNLSLDSGAGTGKEALLGFRDNGTATWWVGKNFDGRFQIMNGGKSRSAIAADDDGTSVKLGFFGAAAPVARPTVTGSRGGNAALASLLTALASMGLIVDSTSA